MIDVIPYLLLKFDFKCCWQTHILLYQKMDEYGAHFHKIPWYKGGNEENTRMIWKVSSLFATVEV